MSQRSDIVLIQTAIGDYRGEFLKCLQDALSSRLRIFVGDQYFQSSTRTSLPEGVAACRLANVFLFHRRLLYQAGAVSAAVGAGVAVLELNPRIISVWIGLVARRLLGRPTVLWGHAWPRKGQASGTDRVRGVMRRLANSILVYTDSQALELMDHDDRLQVVVAPNALYRGAEMNPVSSVDRDGFIYVGRLVAEKKVQLLIEALCSKALEHTAPFPLRIVGDGPERPSLEAAARRLGVEDRVTFYGHVSDRSHLLSIYSLSLGSVSPGYVGLSITQALGFGVPMIIADNEPHAPEIEASKPEFNSIYFHADDAESLANAMQRMTREKDCWIKRATDISADCRSRYSAEVMAERFIACANLAAKQQ